MARCRADEDGGFTDALQARAGEANPTASRSACTPSCGHRGEQGTEDHRRSKTVLFGEAAELRPDEHGSDAEGRQVQTDVDLVATELFFDQCVAAAESSHRCR